MSVLWSIKQKDRAKVQREYVVARDGSPRVTCCRDDGDRLGGEEQDKVDDIARRNRALLSIIVLPLRHDTKDRR